MEQDHELESSDILCVRASFRLSVRDRMRYGKHMEFSGEDEDRRRQDPLSVFPGHPGSDREIPDGKLVVITGPNGGGKTTLAKIIAGIYTQDSGKILLDNSDITDKDITERAKMGISFAFQQPVRFKGITVRKLIELASGNTMNDGQLCRTLCKRIY